MIYKLLIGLYLLISLTMMSAGYTGNSILTIIIYYGFWLLNLCNAVRLANKHIKLEEE